jgi:hypothetical protein
MCVGGVAYVHFISAYLSGEELKNCSVVESDARLAAMAAVPGASYSRRTAEVENAVDEDSCRRLLRTTAAAIAITIATRHAKISTRMIVLLLSPRRCLRQVAPMVVRDRFGRQYAPREHNIGTTRPAVSRLSCRCYGPLAKDCTYSPDEFANAATGDQTGLPQLEVKLDDKTGELKDDATRNFLKQQLEAFAQFIARHGGKA